MPESPERLGSDTPISIEADHSPFVNFAMQTNGVPLIRSIKLTNATAQPIRNLRVRIWCDPPVVAETVLRLDELSAHESTRFQAVSLMLLRAPLRERTEREEGQLWIETTGDGLAPDAKPRPLSVLAYNEWHGGSSLRELVAAHVLPNDPAVEVVLTAARQILQDRTRNGALNGYQSGDPRRAYEQAAAIYWAVASQGIGYVSPPASFETTGQKIRTPEQVISSKLGTCLDTTVFLAACIEQAGLRPLIALLEGHALPGVWLLDKSLDGPVAEHQSFLVNRAALGELLMIESTGLTTNPVTDFQVAQNAARLRLEDRGRFRYVVDVKLARAGGIRPLSLTESAASIVPAGTTTETSDGPGSLAAPEEVARRRLARESTRPETETAASRLARWKASLLDLSLRNRLLNFKDSKKAIPLLCPDIASLEDALASGAKFRVHPKPQAWGADDPRDAALHRAETGVDALHAYLRAQMEKRRLHAAVSEHDVAVRLTEVERASRVGLEEGGANTLFLALGFLHWTESDASGVEHRAPILLIPMTIDRVSVREGFTVCQAGEETRINVTLLQKLRCDFGISIEGLDPLPEDESGLAVPEILRSIREAIKRQPGWRVVEEASLTILTFSRFLMWSDLENSAAALLDNPIIRHLVETPNEPFQPGEQFPELEAIDERYQPAATFCPLPADSSQLRAVLAAAEGRTFVLQGPPGTGKSQTISNLIAHCLAIGKRVLFVAQKKAALDVVHQRLVSVGLGPFCLELHSNKSTRESCRNQIREALEVTAAVGHRDWDAETARLAEIRKLLNDYVQELHEPRAFGKSAFTVMTRLGMPGAKDSLRLDLGDPSLRTDEEYRRMLSAVRELAESARVAGEPATHPLAAVRLRSWTYGLEDDAVRAAREASESLERARVIAPQVMSSVGLDASAVSLADCRHVAKLTLLLERAPAVPRELLIEPDWGRTVKELRAWTDRATQCNRRHRALRETYQDSLFMLDLRGLIATLGERRGARLFRRWRLGTAIKKAVRSARNDGRQPVDLESLERDLAEALSVSEERVRLDARDNLPARLLGPHWKGMDTSQAIVGPILEWADSLRTILDDEVGTDLEARAQNRIAWLRLAVEERDSYCPGSPAAVRAGSYRSALEELDAQLERVADLLALDVEVAWGASPASSGLDRIAIMLGNLQQAIDRLREWTHYQECRAAALDFGLNALVKSLDCGQTRSENLEEAFEIGLADWWARTVLQSVPALAGFLGERHDLRIREFREVESRVADMTRREVFARIASGLPRGTGGSVRSPASSEVGLLQRFCQGGRKTIRRLFDECPNALARYKPCFLMSPLSVAQFIGTKFPRFDLIVFDEASQMPTYEAVGAIARGNQLIVVGDSRQLPPTMFFERQRGDEEFDEEGLSEELESILGEADAAGLKPLQLDWHYRSRHESLIAFSNHQYYGNRLHTFPSAFASHRGLGVQWREVTNGIYDHGRTRTNRREAEAVVAEVVARLRHPDDRCHSLGVVTFSMAQQQLVEDLLDAARSENPEIEPYFTTVDEPVFVKNLETVQGDERDVILFSVCYGPDSAGVVRMNFGPLNNKGGERRLNVAITRARRQLLVFSTLRPEQIDCSRTSALGVLHLQTFLDYSRRGAGVLERETAVHATATESPFERAVFDELAQRGWLVDTQVGCAGYRIDLGVRDPKEPGRYLLGVECDGAHYHSAKCARDRDKLRQSVLEGLGWRLHRIWSTDWWLQRPKQIARLEDALERARVGAAAGEPEPPAPPRPEPAEQVAHSGGTGLVESGPADVPEGQEQYRQFDEVPRGFSGDLIDPSNSSKLDKLVAAIALAEAPLLFDSLCSRAAGAWGLQRAGSRIREAIRGSVKRNGLIVRTAGEREFVWTRELASCPYRGFRVPEESDPSARQAHEICPEEVANAAAQVLTLHISMSEEDLARETANLFGIRRLGATVRASMEAGIALIKADGRCRVEGLNLIAP